MKRRDKALLHEFAAKYIWWKSPDDALQWPERIAAQVMNIGDYDDVQRLVEAFGNGYLQRVLANAEAGQLNERSWHYWHYRLRLAKPGKVPPMPKRRVG